MRRVLAALAESSLLHAGFEPQLSFTLLTERSLACVISIAYDRDGRVKIERAMDCYLGLRREDWTPRATIPTGWGLPIWRLTSNTESERYGYGRLLRSIGQALDPNGILAPGRYVPLGESPHDGGQIVG